MHAALKYFVFEHVAETCGGLGLHFNKVGLDINVI